MSTVEVLLPRPSTRPAAWRGASGFYEPAGKRIAVVENGWGSSQELAKALDRTLRKDYAVADVVHFSNPRMTKSGAKASNAPPDFLEDIAASADIALVALGN